MVPATPDPPFEADTVPVLVMLPLLSELNECVGFEICFKTI